MSILSGTTAGSIKSTALNIPCTIKSFSVYNKTGVAVVVTIAIEQNSSDTYIASVNLAASGSTGSSFYQEANIKVPKLGKIYITTSGSIDYYFTID